MFTFLGSLEEAQGTLLVGFPQVKTCLLYTSDANGVTSQEGGIKLGLDLAGGVSITYQAKEADPSPEDLSLIHIWP